MTEAMKLNKTTVSISSNEAKPTLPIGTEAPSLPGLIGESKDGPGVLGRSESGSGITGISSSGTALYGSSESGEGLHVETSSPIFAAVAAFHLNPQSTGAAIFGRKEGTQGHAGFFVGNVEITGSLTVSNIDLLTRVNRLQELLVTLINQNKFVTNPRLQLEDIGIKIRISGSGFTPLGFIHIFYQYFGASGSLYQNGTDNPLIVQGDITGSFSGITFDLTESSAITTISVRADDLVSNTQATKNLTR